MASYTASLDSKSPLVLFGRGTQSQPDDLREADDRPEFEALFLVSVLSSVSLFLLSSLSDKQVLSFPFFHGLGETSALVCGPSFPSTARLEAGSSPGSLAMAAIGPGRVDLATPC
ncbi:hypothetical protein BT67DRAFT_439537 [Trichocladium antarcticum]|uniref:Uncharacterized protein n=1 Tax=Trichocladium antarcticum TaxID=1450529 RepID=A0AAN6UP83_9PEZI|nr:hypothetical protein BT67DRAFT_439537 [Trichocladium antarcticum]